MAESDDVVIDQYSTPEDFVPEPQPIKRKRGRPRKNPDTVLTFDASEHETDGEFGSPTIKRRTNPRGKNKFEKNIQGGLKGLHYGAAKLLGEPALSISDDEAERLGSAVVDTFDAFGVDISEHPKAAAIFNLTTTVAEIEIPRVIVVLSKPPRQRQSQQTQQQDVPPIIIPGEYVES